MGAWAIHTSLEMPFVSTPGETQDMKFSYLSKSSILKSLCHPGQQKVATEDMVVTPSPSVEMEWCFDSGDSRDDVNSFLPDLSVYFLINEVLLSSSFLNSGKRPCRQSIP